MSSVALQINNLENVINAFRLFPSEVNESLNISAIESGELLSTYARENHKFTHRDHNLEKDIGSRIFGTNEGVILSFGLGFYPSQTSVWWAKIGESVSYGTILHEGSYGDKFIDGAWDANETKVNNNFIAGLNTVIERLF